MKDSGYNVSTYGLAVYNFVFKYCFFCGDLGDVFFLIRFQPSSLSKIFVRKNVVIFSRTNAFDIIFVGFVCGLGFDERNSVSYVSLEQKSLHFDPMSSHWVIFVKKVSSKKLKLKELYCRPFFSSKSEIFPNKSS